MENPSSSTTQVIEREINLIHDKASFHRETFDHIFVTEEPTKWFGIKTPYVPTYL